MKNEILKYAVIIIIVSVIVWFIFKTTQDVKTENKKRELVNRIYGNMFDVSGAGDRSTLEKNKDVIAEELLKLPNADVEKLDVFFEKLRQAVKDKKLILIPELAAQFREILVIANKTNLKEYFTLLRIDKLLV